MIIVYFKNKVADVEEFNLGEIIFPITEMYTSYTTNKGKFFEELFDDKYLMFQRESRMDSDKVIFIDDNFNKFTYNGIDVSLPALIKIKENSEEKFHHLADSFDKIEQVGSLDELLKISNDDPFDMV